MTKYFSVKKNTNYTLTVSKSGYDTHTETINISADTTKNITLQPSFTPETRTFNYTGAVQTYTIPQGCTSLIVDCVGAASKQVWTSSAIFNDAAANGKGGRVQCKLKVTAGQTINIYVGGNNGYNGGGSIKNGSTQWCYGGGSSAQDEYLTCGGGGGGSSYTDPNLCSNVTHTQGYSSATDNGWIIITTSNE